MNFPDTPNPNLLPMRHPLGDLFICDVADAVLKDTIDQLEHPFYSLTKKPETTVRRYEQNRNWLEMVPSVKGMATIYDKDNLIPSEARSSWIPAQPADFKACAWAPALCSR